MTPQLQEVYLIEDLLFVMTGIEGNYIKKKYDQLQKPPYIYCIEPYLEQTSCEPSFKQLVNKILEICIQYDQIMYFSETHSSFEYGTVCQAFCACINILLREYVLMVNQLDGEFQKGQLSLQKLWFYIQPSMKIMEGIFKMCQICENAKGGELLSKLFGLLKSQSDKQIVDIYYFVLQKSFGPFAEILSYWIYSGKIKDQYQEFFIQENFQVQKNMISKNYKDNYWEKKFVLLEKYQPIFLQDQIQFIYKTGKYLNVLSEYQGKIINNQNEMDLLLNYEQYIQISDFSSPIMKAYKYANQQIMKQKNIFLSLLYKFSLIIVEQDFPKRLQSLKNYFFLEKGDFFVHLIDSCEEELQKPAQLLSKEKLESLLEMSIRTSSLSSDIFLEDLTYDISQYTLSEQLFAYQNIQKTYSDTNSSLQQQQQEKFKMYIPARDSKGIELFSLDYNVKWPLNLILNRKTLTKYQLLFRHLFQFKIVERNLCKTWIFIQSAKELNLINFFKKSYYLLSRMLHFVKNFVYYICFEVIEQKWTKFINNIKNVSEFDDILILHETFLDQCLKESVLLDQNIVKTLQKINQTCSLFSLSIQKYIDNLKIDQKQNNNFNNFMIDEKLNYIQTRKQIINVIINLFLQKINIFIIIYNIQSKTEKILQKL
ncbi:hypothetical protein IMG5_103560 [Ichthyophthirius multifiliis]|uniref:Spindle pole body component n=1 Tax=Ichthyophthirius multifiliis TaxID=5932 RepID=G0QSU5_ICHMU|nr:hypothetical protein IMG5_103560 [Ichthyophthirius multifiliis]EGR31712.1 hypothetical protein IMG5_103560 [Ichthyophthirius multifiliis]|eukprot:XP_004035198.1 hypothetical protein IMG5_103560 [Ichthyophthirius multifiliis]